MDAPTIPKNIGPRVLSNVTGIGSDMVEGMKAERKGEEISGPTSAICIHGRSYYMFTSGAGAWTNVAVTFTNSSSAYGNTIKMET